MESKQNGSLYFVWSISILNFDFFTVDAGQAGPFFFSGRGAGEAPTASAVVADIADIAKGIRSAPFGLPVSRLEPLTRSPMQRHEGGYYIRLSVVDRAGAIGAIATRMGALNISLESIMQKPVPAEERSTGEHVPVVLITHATSEDTIREALEAVSADGTISGRPQVIRIERE